MIRISGFKVLRKLGSGGMAEVYLCIHEAQKRMVAVKVLTEDALSDKSAVLRFMREAKIISSLKHPNIVEIYGSGYTHDKRFYLVLEYMKYGDLENYIRMFKPDLKEILHLLLGIMDALYFMHSKGIVHRDVKPSNILVNEKKIAKISDFGIAGFLWGRSTRFTRTGETLGTVSYMAPEQSMDAKHVDHRADIYSLGVILYEITTGKLPVGAVEPPSKLNPEVPEYMSELILKAIAPDKHRRFPSMKIMKEAFLKVLKEDVLETKPITPKKDEEKTVLKKEDNFLNLYEKIKKGSITEKLNLREKFIESVKEENFDFIERELELRDGMLKDILILSLSKIKNKKADELLKRFLNDPLSRDTAIEAISRREDKESYNLLLPLLKLPCEKLKKAFLPLIKSGNEMAKEKVVECLYSEFYEVKKSALKAIDESEDRWFKRYVEDFLKKEKDPELKGYSKLIVDKLS